MSTSSFKIIYGIRPNSFNITNKLFSIYLIDSVTRNATSISSLDILISATMLEEENYQGDDGILVGTKVKSNISRSKPQCWHFNISPEVWSSLRKALFVVGSVVIIFIAVSNSVTQ